MPDRPMWSSPPTTGSSSRACRPSSGSSPPWLGLCMRSSCSSRATSGCSKSAATPTGSVQFVESPTEPAWAARTATGSRQLARAGRQHGGWCRPVRHPAYVLYGTQWELAPGAYQLTVTLASSAACNVEVWDSTSGKSLARRRVPSLDAPAAVQTQVVVTGYRTVRPYSGWGPFSFIPRPPPSFDSIEVRVWTEGRVRWPSTTWRCSQDDMMVELGVARDR